MERLPSEVTEALDEFLGDYLFPPRADGNPPRFCPVCAEQGRSGGELHLRGGRFGAFIGCSNYPECAYRRRFGQPGGEGEGGGENEVLGTDPESGLPVERKIGRFGPYVQLGEGQEAKRASIPKDVDDFGLEWALKLLALPRIVGQHPETGEPIEANIGRYGPYLRHAGKYAKLASTRDVFETGMNAAVSLLAEAAANRGGGGTRAKAEPIKVLGAHPTSGGEMKVMPGRYGPYVSDGTTNATIPKDVKPEDLTAEQAIALIDARASAAPAKGKGKRKAPAKKAPGKAAAAKKAPTKKAVPSKAKAPARKSKVAAE
jgi:DNA topoisomerase-1